MQTFCCVLEVQRREKVVPPYRLDKWAPSSLWWAHLQIPIAVMMMMMMMILSHACPRLRRYNQDHWAPHCHLPRDSAVDMRPVPVTPSHVKQPELFLPSQSNVALMSSRRGWGSDVWRFAWETQTKRNGRLDISAEECDVCEVMWNTASPQNNLQEGSRHMTRK